MQYPLVKKTSKDKKKKLFPLFKKSYENDLVKQPFIVFIGGCETVLSIV